MRRRAPHLPLQELAALAFGAHELEDPLPHAGGVHPQAVQAAARAGLDLSGARPRALTGADAAVDLIVETALGIAETVGPVALLTETAAGWFPRFGFTVTSRDRLPRALPASAQVRHVCPASATTMIRDAATPPRC